LTRLAPRCRPHERRTPGIETGTQLLVRKLAASRFRIFSHVLPFDSRTTASGEEWGQGKHGVRSSRQGCDPAGAHTSPAVSIVRIRTRSDAGACGLQGRGYCPVYTARRPQGLSALTVGAARGPSKHGSLNMREWLQPRNLPPRKAVLRDVSRADPLDPKGRPMPSGKQRTRAPFGRGGVRTQAPVQGSQR
jgi:hypothetical protein